MSCHVMTYCNMRAVPGCHSILLIFLVRVSAVSSRNQQALKKESTGILPLSSI